MPNSIPKSIIDFHVHVFPEPRVLDFLKPEQNEKVQQWRRQGRKIFKAFPDSLHRLQPLVRRAPQKIRNILDQVGAVSTLPHLILEATPGDLGEAMIQSNLDFAVVLAQPPYTPNEFILQEARQNSKLVPFVNVPPSENQPGKKLKEYVKGGARGLKIHAAMDGLPMASAHYKNLLDAAADEGLPVILHTGCIHMSFFYKKPDQSLVQNFEPWFKAYPKTHFILAHMNFHDPDKALDLMCRYENLWADTSWQPTDVIVRAAKRVGAERILFATDWPLGGHNMAVGLGRIHDAVFKNALTQDQCDLICGNNARTLLKI